MTCIIAKFSPDGYEEVSRTPLIAPTSNSHNRRRLGGVSWVAAAYANRHVLIRNDEEVLSASLAAADYPNVPSSSAPVRRAAVTRPAAPAATDVGRPPLIMQFAASESPTGDPSTSQYGEFYLLSGRGTNTPVFVVDDGVVVVDPARSGSFEEIRAEVDRITDKPITTIVNTLAHAPDPDNLAGYPESGRRRRP